MKSLFICQSTAVPEAQAAVKSVTMIQENYDDMVCTALPASSSSSSGGAVRAESRAARDTPRPVGGRPLPCLLLLSSVYQSGSGQSVSDLCRTALSHSPLGLPVRHSLLFLLLLLLLSLLVLERETRCSMAASKLAR